MAPNTPHYDLNNYNVPEFEKLIINLLLTDSLNKCTFSRRFTNREKQIICNRYIASYFYQIINFMHQIELFAKSCRINLALPFDVSKNHYKHNVELDRYTVQQLQEPSSRQSILAILASQSQKLYVAITSNNHTDVYESNKYGINVNYPINGRLPLELACQFSSDAIVQNLLLRGANPLLFAPNGFNAILSMCINNRLGLISALCNILPNLFEEFLDLQNSQYCYGRDALRIMIDNDNAALLDAAFAINERDLEILLPSTSIRNMLNYAIAANKSNCSAYLGKKLEYYSALEQGLMQAILTGSVAQLKDALQKKVNMNLKINNEYPLELAVKIGNVAVVEALAEHPTAELYLLTDAADPQYNQLLDVSYLAIYYEKIEILNAILFDEDQEHDCKNDLLLELIIAKAEELDRPVVYNYALSLVNQNAANLFAAAMAGDLRKLREALRVCGDPNIKVNGRSVMHVIAERGYVEILNFLLHYPNVAVNEADSNGDYPITLACKLDSPSTLFTFLNSSIVRVLSFKDVDLPNYEQKLDVLRCIILFDNVALLEHVLRRSQTDSRLVYINKSSINDLYQYSMQQNKPQCAKRLSQYVAILSNKPTLFDLKQVSDIKRLTEDAQGISNVELSFIVSLNKLCQRYNIPIEVLHDTDGKFHRKLKFDKPALKILKQLEDMIAATCDIKYPLYKKDPQNPDNYVFNRYLSLEEYKNWAIATYAHLVNSLNGLKGDSRGDDTWRSSWFDFEKNLQQISAGVTMGEVWCLAIIAMRDRNAVAGRTYDEADIRDREQILVHTLVECHRAYAYTKDYHDDLDNEKESCPHGIAIRAMLALCGLHDDVHIQESPLEWAHIVAQETLLAYYESLDNKQQLNDLLLKHRIQLTPEEKKIISDFYKSAKKLVDLELRTTLGMTADATSGSTPGYLTEKDLAEILNNLPDIDLPLTSMRDIEVERKVLSASDFTLLDLPEFSSADQLPLRQFRLPLSADSGFAAIIISALGHNIANAVNFNVAGLRATIANILRAAFDNIDTFRASSNSWFPNCKIDPRQIVVVCSAIRQMFNNRGMEQADIRDKYISAVATYAEIDSLSLQICSAIFGCSIACYDLSGVFVSEINSAQLFLVPQHSCHLDIVYKINRDGNRYIQDYSIVNAAVSLEAWQNIAASLLNLGLTTSSARIVLDEAQCCNFAVMYGRRVLGSDQIKIPNGSDNIVTAVLVGARHINAPECTLFSRPSELQNALLNLKLSSAVDIEDFEYLANLLELKIEVYCAVSQTTNSYGTNEVNIVRLYNNCGHYNLLVAPNSWRGLQNMGLVFATQQDTQTAEKRAKMAPS
jgi:ankyrin repeat protein